MFVDMTNGYITHFDLERGGHKRVPSDLVETCTCNLRKLVKILQLEAKATAIALATTATPHHQQQYYGDYDSNQSNGVSFLARILQPHISEEMQLRLLDAI